MEVVDIEYSGVTQVTVGRVLWCLEQSTGLEVGTGLGCP